MIELKDITKKYHQALNPAVDGLSLCVNSGEVAVLIGPSGCGKTTTLRMINRLIEPTSGEIFIDGHNAGKRRAEELRRSIGYAIQSVGLFPHMTVADNIAVVPELLSWGKERIEDRVAELINLVGLNPEEYLGKYPHQLSGGEAQRIGVARALAADPPILLMDEPFGAVDPLTRERLQMQFLSIQKQLKKTVILVTHDLDEAIRLADRVAIMREGKLIQYDTPEVILKHPADKFVRDFVGADRALKRLSRINIRPFISAAFSVSIDSTMERIRAVCDQRRWIWVTDNEGILLGWLDCFELKEDKTLTEVFEEVTREEFALLESASFREALSRMLSQGVKNSPVINDKGLLVGELSMSAIEKATDEGDA